VARNTGQLRVVSKKKPKIAIVVSDSTDQMDQEIPPDEAPATNLHQTSAEVVKINGEVTTTWHPPKPYVVTRNLDEVNGLVLGLLDQRIAEGDDAMQSVRNLLCHYIDIIVNMEPMAHLGCAPLRPDDRLVEAFSQIIDLMHAQNQQLDELQRLITDIV
jgi:hypothetical protein